MKPTYIALAIDKIAQIVASFFWLEQKTQTRTFDWPIQLLNTISVQF